MLKDDTQIREAFHIFKKKKKKICFQTSGRAAANHLENKG